MLRGTAHELEDIMPQSDIRRYLRHGTLPQLSVLEAVIRRGNFTRAAEELHMAQPTASILLKKLSERVGLPLVEQIGRQAHPTEAGRCVAETCGQIFGALAELENKLDNLRQLKGGRLRLAMGPAGKYFAPRLLAAFAPLPHDVALSRQVHAPHTLLGPMAANPGCLYVFPTPPGGARG